MAYQIFRFKNLEVLHEDLSKAQNELKKHLRNFIKFLGKNEPGGYMVGWFGDGGGIKFVKNSAVYIWEVYTFINFFHIEYVKLPFSCHVSTTCAATGKNLPIKISTSTYKMNLKHPTQTPFTK